jgi:hypothetical protein
MALPKKKRNQYRVRRYVSTILKKFKVLIILDAIKVINLYYYTGNVSTKIFLQIY